METVNVHAAKTGLSRLLKRVEAGEEVIIARNGTPVAKLTPVEKRGRPSPTFSRARPSFQTRSLIPCRKKS